MRFDEEPLSPNHPTAGKHAARRVTNIRLTGKLSTYA